MNRLGIYTNNTKYDLASILAHIRKTTEFDDVVVFTDLDGIATYREYAILPSFYSRFFNGVLVFTDTEHYIEKQPKVISEMFFLVSDLKELLEHNIDGSFLRNHNTILIDKNELKTCNTIK